MKTILISIFLAAFFTMYGQIAETDCCNKVQKWDKIKVNEASSSNEHSKIFVISNRPYDEDNKRNELFPNKLTEFREVNYFTASCNNGHWELSLKDDFLSGMEAIDDGGNILVYVHGHGQSLPLVLKRAAQISNRYNISLVIFDWPSANNNFNKSLARVRRSGPNFYNLILQLDEYRATRMQDDQNLSLMLHSLGNYFVTHFVINGTFQYINNPVFDNLILSAPAVRSKEHSEVLSKLNIQKRLYVEINRNDKILRAAHILTSGKMLGNVVLGPKANNAVYVDFTEIAEREHTLFAGRHQFEYDMPVFYYYYSNVMNGEPVDFSNTNMFKAGTDNSVQIATNKSAEEKNNETVFNSYISEQD